MRQNCPGQHSEAPIDLGPACISGSLHGAYQPRNSPAEATTMPGCQCREFAIQAEKLANPFPLPGTSRLVSLRLVASAVCSPSNGLLIETPRVTTHRGNKAATLWVLCFAMFLIFLATLWIETRDWLWRSGEITFQDFRESGVELSPGHHFATSGDPRFVQPRRVHMGSERDDRGRRCARQV